MDERILQEGQSIIGVAREKRDQLQNLADSQLGAKSMNDLMENTRKHMIERSILDPIAMPFLAKFGGSATVKTLGGAVKRGLKYSGRELGNNLSDAAKGVKAEVRDFGGQFRRDGAATWEEFKASDVGKGIFKVGSAVRQMNPEAWEATARNMASNGGDIFRGATETGNRFLNGEHGVLPTADDVRNFINRTANPTVQSESDLMDSRFGGIDATGDSPDQNLIDNVKVGEWAGRNTPEDQILGTADTSIEKGVETDLGQVARPSIRGASVRGLGDGLGGREPSVNTQYGAPQSQRNLPEAGGDPQGEVPEEPVEAELNTSSKVDFNPADEGLANTDLITTGTASKTAGNMSNATGETSGLLGDIGDASSSESGAMTIFDGLSTIDALDAPLDAVPGLDIATIGGDLATAALGLGILGAGQVYNSLFDKDKSENLNQGLQGAKSVVSFASQFGTEN